MVDVDGAYIPDNNMLTLVAKFPTSVVEEADYATFVFIDLLDSTVLFSGEWTVTEDGYVGLSGDACGSWIEGLVKGVYLANVTFGERTFGREFRLDTRYNGNLVPEKWRPKYDTDPARVSTLDIVPFATMPRDLNRWADRPYYNGDNRRGKLTKINRINHVMPGPPGDPSVYSTMECIGVVYRTPGDAALTYEERTEQTEEWFDLKIAIETATNGTRTVDLATEQHSGIRTISFHPNYAQNGLIYVSYLETWDDTIPPEVYLSLHGDDEENLIRATGDSVLAEFKVYNASEVGSKIDPMSYRPLFRISYNETGAYAIYEHPIKQCDFGSTEPPYVVYCGSGDGSVDSQIAFGGRDNNIYGKIIAVDVGDGEYTEPYTYGIPEINVWGNGTDPSACCAAEHRAETYAIGLRNPHRVTFVRKGPYKGVAIVADAGRDNAEEINVISGPGQDFGWYEREGWFVHLDRPGIGDGVDPVLPADDADNGWIYPAAFLGHNGLNGLSFSAQAIVGSHVVQTEGSDLENRYFLSDFPMNATIDYCMLDDMMTANTTGPPETLTMAPIYKSIMRYFATDEDYSNNVPSIARTEHFNDIIQVNTAANIGPNLQRTDLRFGEGIYGELLIISKRVGTIYVVKNSLPGVTALP